MSKRSDGRGINECEASICPPPGKGDESYPYNMMTSRYNDLQVAATILSLVLRPSNQPSC